MALDSCITNIFSEANAPSDSGSVGRPQYTGYILTEGDAAGGGGSGAVTGTVGPSGILIGPGPSSAGTVRITITGDFIGPFAISQGVVYPGSGHFVQVISGLGGSPNVTDLTIFGDPNGENFRALGGVGTSGLATVTFNPTGNRIKILAASAFVGYLKLKGS
jgi:hypothetical protein